MKIIDTSDAGAVVAIDRPEEALEAARFHMLTLRQPLLALRFPQWIALARASIDLARHGVPHRSSGIIETASEFFAAHARGGLHLFLDDPPGRPPALADVLQPDDHTAAVKAALLAQQRAHMGGALGAWARPGGCVYRLAATVGHALAIRRATVAERERGLGFVHLFLACKAAVVTCGWPDDPQLDQELVQAEASIAALGKAKGDA